MEKTKHPRPRISRKSKKMANRGLREPITVTVFCRTSLREPITVTVFCKTSLWKPITATVFCRTSLREAITVTVFCRMSLRELITVTVFHRMSLKEPITVTVFTEKTQKSVKNGGRFRSKRVQGTQNAHRSHKIALNIVLICFLRNAFKKAWRRLCCETRPAPVFCFHFSSVHENSLQIGIIRRK